MGMSGGGGGNEGFELDLTPPSEEVTMHSSSVSHEDPGPGRHVHTEFGDYEVYAHLAAAAEAGSGTNRITEQELATLQTAWHDIHSGVGMDIHGSAEDKAEFDYMLKDGMQNSETFRHTIEEIAADPTHEVHVDLGERQPDTFVDNFATNSVDLDDLSRFPTHATLPRHDRDAETQSEEIEHVLEERHYAAVHYNEYTDHGGKSQYFQDAHLHAVASENQIRDEWGQSMIATETGGDGSLVDTFYDGRSEQMAETSDGLQVTEPERP
jgi:hypothetical protein